MTLRVEAVHFSGGLVGTLQGLCVIYSLVENEVVLVRWFGIFEIVIVSQLTSMDRGGQWIEAPHIGIALLENPEQIEIKLISRPQHKMN